MNKKALQNQKQKQEILEELAKHNINISIGDTILTSDGDLYVIDKIDKEGIHLKNRLEDDPEQSHYGTINVKDFISRDYIKLDKPIEEFEKELANNFLNLDKYEEDKTESTSTEIAVKSSKAQLVNLKNSLEDKKRNIMILERILYAKRNYMQSIVHDLEEKVEKIYKVLDIIELYLGIYETIIQIQKGPKAKDSDPITFRQAVLFMDEEVGDPEDQGLDFKKIEQFDDWLLKNYKKILTEEKCVVVMKPRRHDKDYGGNWYENFIMNRENHRTYFLIRNGMNFYRIDSNIHVDKLFFPGKDEMEEIYKIANEDFGHDKDEAEDIILSYKRNALMMQGLIDRTEIFHPLPHYINIFDQKTYKKAIQFVRDGETCLPDGHKSFKDWKEALNSKIKIGSRIVFSGFGHGEFSTYESSHYANQAKYYHRFPCVPENMPERGIYTVELYYTSNSRYSEGKEMLLCKYAQGGERRIGWGYEAIERKNRTSFYLYRNDYCVFNYDMLELDDIEFYINSRIDRENYRENIPLLWEIKKQRLKELEWEKGFVEHLKLEIDYDNKKELEKIIWDCITWWKNKVIWKRPIMKDDAKALRMIKGRINRIIREKK